MSCHLSDSFKDRGENTFSLWWYERNNCGFVCRPLSKLYLALLCIFSVREFMAFTSEVLVQRTSPGQRQSVKEQG